MQHLERAYARYPHHGRSGIADDAARAAGIGRRNDCGDITEVHFAAEHRRGHGPADHRRCDVVQKTRQHENDQQQAESALPVIGQKIGQQLGGAAVLEVLRQQREPDQQSQQIAQDHPFVPKMRYEPCHPRTGLEAGEPELVQGNGDEPGHCNLQGMPVQQRYAEQGKREKDEIKRDVA